ncbi:paraquat-inducible protein B [Cerasicoccus arenae]|uniref:Paraquat-inducible protein B n=2 Tax=Cerasicoccus arenae TaxID=424488 RepID=A0A8J3DGV6_9BACT|nr:paraquat-inducible protein B [Cerasicoccus arenae]
MVAIVLATAALVVFGSGSFLKQQGEFVLYFEDSVNGLATGAPVKFKGVPIGQVKEILIRFNQEEDSSSIPVIIEIDLTRLRTTLGVDIELDDSNVLTEQINAGLRATLQQASFVTGLLFVELNYVTPAPPPVFHQIQNDSPEYLEIPTLQSGLTEIIKKVSKMVNQISQIDFASMGRRLNDTLAKLDKGIGQVDFKGLSDQAKQTLKSIEELATNEDLKKAFANLDKTLDDLQGLINNLDGDMGVLVENVNLTLVSARDTLDKFSMLAADADNMVAPDSPLRYELTSALSELAGAMRSMRVLADYLERNPSALLTGKQEQ